MPCPKIERRPFSFLHRTKSSLKLGRHLIQRSVARVTSLAETLFVSHGIYKCINPKGGGSCTIVWNQQCCYFCRFLVYDECIFLINLCKIHRFIACKNPSGEIYLVNWKGRFLTPPFQHTYQEIDIWIIRCYCIQFWRENSYSVFPPLLSFDLSFQL